MSLRIWLPLTKDLRQQGLSNIIPINNGGVTYNSTGGKLGGCYIFDGVDDAITIGNLSTLVTDNFSFACWFYHDDTWSSKNYETIFGGPSGFELETKNGSTQSPVIRAYSWGGSTFTYELNKWNHLVMTRTTSETKFYLNGELKLTGTAGTIPSGNYFIGSWSSTTGQNFKGKVNDVRIYDHCLSSMEVKELAKGLVLHYPLSDNSIQSLDNCYAYPRFETSNSNGGWSHWGSSGHVGTYGQTTDTNYIFRNGQTYAHWVADGSSATKDYLLYQEPAFDGGLRSLVAICKEENSKPITNDICYATWNARNGGVTNNSWTSIQSLGNGFYLCKCEGISQDGSNDLVGIYIKPGYKVYFSEVYLENNRSISSDMFFPTNIVYDCSGFCNNGTISGTLTIASDTPKYAISTYMPKAALITHPRPVFGGTDQEWTCAMWVKLDVTSQANQYMNNFNSGNHIVYSANGVPLLYLNSGTNDYYNYGNLAISAGVWTHIVFVFKNSNVTKLIYINGVEHTNKNGPNKTSTPLGIPDIITIGTNLAGYISDYRIYATALSADDVKSLYQNSAYIDSSGNVYGAVH